MIVRRKNNNGGILFSILLVVVLLVLFINVEKQWQVFNQLRRMDEVDSFRENFFRDEVPQAMHRQHEFTRRQEVRETEHHYLALQRRRVQQITSTNATASTASYNKDKNNVESYAVNTFHYSFFSDDNRLQSDVAPTQEMYQGLLCQTKAYYLQMLQHKLGNSIYVNLYSQSWTYEPYTPFPVTHSVVVHATFEDGSPLDARDINRCVRASQMTEYIEQFVWKAEPLLEPSWFVDVNKVVVEVSTQPTKVVVKVEAATTDTENDNQEADIVLGSTRSCPTNGFYEAIFQYGYFPGFAKKPSPQEIQHLKPLTEQYLSRVLQSSYGSRQVKVSLDMQGWDFNEATLDDMPLTIRYYLTAYFTYGGGDVIPMEYVKQKLVHDENVRGTIMKEYIENAVWEVPPFKNSTLWNVNRVRMRNKIYRLMHLPSRGEEDNNKNSDGKGSMGGTIDGSIGDDHRGDKGRPEVNGIQSIYGLPDSTKSDDFGFLSSDETNDGARPGPTRTTLHNVVLEPISIRADECREFLTNANANLDRLLNTTEFITFLNYMTGNTYAGFPWAALPDAVQGCFEKLSIRTDDDQLAVDLLGAFRPDISQKDLNILAAERANKVCQYTQANLNDAVTKSPVRSNVLISNVKFFAQYTSDSTSKPNYTALNTGFESVVSGYIGPGLKASMANTARKLQLHTSVSRRFTVPREMRRLQQNDTAIYVVSLPAAIDLEETDCRDQTDVQSSCFNAVAGFNTFLKGKNVLDMALILQSNADELAEDAVAYGELGNEVSSLDPAWTINTIIARTSMPSLAPSSLSSSVPNIAHKSDHEDQSIIKRITDLNAGAIAMAVLGLTVLMITVLCCVVDLFVRICKGFGKRSERSGEKGKSEFGNEVADDFRGSKIHQEGIEDNYCIDGEENEYGSQDGSRSGESHVKYSETRVRKKQEEKEETEERILDFVNPLEPVFGENAVHDKVVLDKAVGGNTNADRR